MARSTKSVRLLHRVRLLCLLGLVQGQFQRQGSRVNVLHDAVVQVHGDAVALPLRLQLRGQRPAFILQPLAFRYVTYNRREQVRSPLSNGLRLISSGKLAAVLAATHQVQAQAHRPDLRVVDVGLTVRLVYHVQARRDQRAHRPANQLISLIAKHLLGGSVSKDDRPLLVHDHEAIGC